MSQPKTLDAARAMIADLSAQVAEIASLREQASQVESLRTELAESKNEIDLLNSERVTRIAGHESEIAAFLATLKSSKAEVEKLQAEAKSAELRALEITGNIGGAPLAVSENADEKLTLSDVVSAINAEKDPVKKGLLFKQYQKLQSK